MRYQDRPEDRARRRLRRHLHAAVGARRRRCEPVVRHDAGRKATTYSNSAKMGLAMKRRFWEEDEQIFGGHLYSNLPLGEFSYPSHDYFSKKGVLLGLYSNGPIGDLIDRPVKERVEHVLTHASKVHPQIRQEFESAYAVWWKKVKYNLGGFAPGAPPMRRAQFAKVDNRILIGSAADRPVLRTGLAGRRGCRSVAGGEVAARARHAQRSERIDGVTADRIELSNRLINPSIVPDQSSTPDSAS